MVAIGREVDRLDEPSKFDRLQREKEIRRNNVRSIMEQGECRVASNSIEVGSSKELPVVPLFDALPSQPKRAQHCWLPKLLLEVKACAHLGQADAVLGVSEFLRGD